MDKLCSYRKIIFSVASISLLAGCTNQGYSVIASTATTIGIGVSQQPTSGMIDATLGYKRAEVAFVPTNRNAGEKAGEINGQNGSGAKDSANVIMELRYSDLFAAGEKSGIYQRLAVGETAVKQPGATLMFTRDDNGKIDTNAQNAIAALRDIPTVQPKISSLKKIIAEKYKELKSNPDDLEKFKQSILEKYDRDFDKFLTEPNTSEQEIKDVENKLKAAGISFDKL
jgi:hypothetical protein